MKEEFSFRSWTFGVLVGTVVAGVAVGYFWCSARADRDRFESELSRANESVKSLGVKIENLKRGKRRIFDDVPLREVIEAFAAYNERPIFVIADSQAGLVRISGLLDLGATHSFVKVLEINPVLAIEKKGDEVIIRSRR